jgi:PAS domain S-box-containing protein
MQAHFEDPALEIKRLQRCMSDLVSILAMPIVWRGHEPVEILDTFVDSLMRTLHLDFLFAQVTMQAGEAPIEVLKVGPSFQMAGGSDQIAQSFAKWLKDNPIEQLSRVRRRFGSEEPLANCELSMLLMRMGVEGELGFIVAGSERTSFPEQAESLILNVASNQAAIGIQQALLLNEQKRVAGELDRRVAERTRELAETNKELQLQVGLLQHLPVSAWTLNPDGTPDFVNRVWLEFSGQTLDFIRSHPEAWMTAIHPEDREAASKAFWEGVRAGKDFGFETRSRRARDGAYRWHLQQAMALRDAEGKVLRFVGTTTDIDDQKRAEEELRASEGKLLRVIDTIPSLSWCNLPDGPNEFLSKGWHDYTGLSPEEAHGWGWATAFHPDDLPLLMKRWQELLISGEPGEIEARIRRHDGEFRWFLIRVAPFRDDTGAIARWYGTSTDIHDRKLADEALRASETQLRQIVDSIPGLICTMNLAGEMTTLNKQLLEYFGKKPEELKSWRMTDAVHPDDLPRVAAAFDHSIRTGTPYEVEHRCQRADGIYRWFQVRALPVQDKDGQAAGWYVLLTDIEDRKRAEDELKRSEARHRVVVETANDAVISIDENSTIILANPATNSIFGYEPQELIGKPLTVLMPEVMRALHETGFKRYLETGVRHHNWRGTELTALRADGKEFPAEVSFGEMTADGKKIFTGFIRDISEKKRAEEVVLANERNLGLIINTMPVLAWSALPDGNADFFNQRWLDYTGLSAGDALGWNWSGAFHPDDLDRITDYWRSLISSGKAGEIEARLRRCDGGYRWFLIRGSPLRDETGAIVKWYGTNTDIHDRKLAEEKVLRSEAFLAEAQRLTRVGSFSWRVAADEIKWSEQLYHIFEFDPGISVTFDLIRNRFHPEDVVQLDEMVEKVRRGATELEYEHRIRTPSGSVKYLRLVAHTSRDHDGRLEYIGAIQDVTQRQLAEAALATARAELAKVTRITSLGAFTASLAHEVNQPLSGIITNAGTCLRMLNSEPPNIEGARETVRRTIRDGNRASDVISRLRGLFSKKEVIAEPVDLNEATREVIALSLSDLQRHQVTLQLELADSLPSLQGDRIQLQQVVFNLVRNASEAMSVVEDRPRRLVIRTEHGGGSVRLAVQDSGVGFANGDAERVFESFFTTKEDGMGIGLSVSRSIIEAHQGRLWAAPNEGPGATFAFTIPCEQAG